MKILTEWKMCLFQNDRFIIKNIFCLGDFPETCFIDNFPLERRKWGIYLNVHSSYFFRGKTLDSLSSH